MIFRALDTETEKTVAVRRFFPFGADGGGLHPDEQAAYNIAVGRLASVQHPALRAVIGGGCDPVDGMPFIATEWIEGDPVLAFLAQGPLPPEIAAELIHQALEVSELLSQVFAEEAVWVETDLQMIIVGGEQTGRRFTFWISPLKWLGANEKIRGLGPIIRLTEEIMGWQNRRVNDQAGQGLGGWLKWLRLAGATASLREARERLIAAVGNDPPPDDGTLETEAARPPAKAVAPASSKMTWLINVSLALVALGLGGWLLHLQRSAQETLALGLPPALLQAPQKPAPAGPVRRPAAAPAALTPTADPEHARVLAAQKEAAEKNRGVIAWASRELLVSNAGKEVTVEGVFEDIGFSNSKKTLYLLFSKTPDPNDSRGAVLLKSAAADLSEESLRKLISNKIRLRGVVDVEKLGGLQRPEIRIKDRASIQVAE